MKTTLSPDVLTAAAFNYPDLDIWGMPNLVGVCQSAFFSGHSRRPIGLTLADLRIYVEQNGQIIDTNIKIFAQKYPEWTGALLVALGEFQTSLLAERMEGEYDETADGEDCCYDILYTPYGVCGFHENPEMVIDEFQYDVRDLETQEEWDECAQDVLTKGLLCSVFENDTGSGHDRIKRLGERENLLDNWKKVMGYLCPNAIDLIDWHMNSES